MDENPLSVLIEDGQRLLEESYFSSAKMDVWSLRCKRTLGQVFDKEIADKFDHMLNASAVFRRGESLFMVYRPKIVNAIDYLESLKSVEMPAMTTKEQSKVSDNLYIRPNIITGFANKQKQSKFNFKKLIRLLEQLNENYSSGNEYAAAMLIRGILDHIPPLLGVNGFDQVANNYPWSKTDKAYMLQLLNSKPISDDVLHRQIGSAEDIIEIGHLPSGVHMNRLLQECLGSDIEPGSKPKPQPKAEKSKTEIVMREPFVEWANWSGLTRSFRAKVTFNNYNNAKPNFIEKVVLKAADAGGGPWIAEVFKISNSHLNERYKIEPHDKKDTEVLIGQQSNPNLQPWIPMPDLDRDSATLEFSLADGTILQFTCKLRENQ